MGFKSFWHRDQLSGEREREKAIIKRNGRLDCRGSPPRCRWFLLKGPACDCSWPMLSIFLFSEFSIWTILMHAYITGGGPSLESCENGANWKAKKNWGSKIKKLKKIWVKLKKKIGKKFWSLWGLICECSSINCCPMLKVLDKMLFEQILYVFGHYHLSFILIKYSTY
jgi:hypothetical protein